MNNKKPITKEKYYANKEREQKSLEERKHKEEIRNTPVMKRKSTKLIITFFVILGLLACVSTLVQNILGVILFLGAPVISVILDVLFWGSLLDGH